MQQKERTYYGDTSTVLYAGDGSSYVPSTTPEYVAQFEADTAANYPYIDSFALQDDHLTGAKWTNSQGAWTVFKGQSGKGLAISSATPTTTTLTFGYDVATGYKMSVSSFSFYQRSSSTGYAQYTMSINGTQVGSGNIFVDIPNKDNPVQWTGDQMLTTAMNNLTGHVTVVITLSGGTNGYNGTFRMDNFSLNGYTVPTSYSNSAPNLYIHKYNYRYGFNGKENDNEVEGEGNEIAFEARIYDPRIGRFLSGDILYKSYPYQSPYAFAANCPTKLIDALGLSPGDNVKRGEGPAAYAKRNNVSLAQLAISNQGVFKNYDPNGTWSSEQKSSYWKNNKNWNMQPGNPLQLNPIFASGSLHKNSDDLDQEKHPETENPQAISFYSEKDHNAVQAFKNGFKTGTAFKSTNEENKLMNTFLDGTGSNTDVTFTMPSNSGIAGVLSNIIEFKNAANSFEGMVQSWFSEHHTLAGFDGNTALTASKPKYMGNLESASGLYAYTIMGGYSMISAEIKVLNADQIKVSYTITDHFGAGADDSYKWWYPGLPGFYYGQHYDNENKTKNKPFIWNVNIIRNH